MVACANDDSLSYDEQEERLNQILYGVYGKPGVLKPDRFSVIKPDEFKK
jgi:hypothetical protein